MVLQNPSLVAAAALLLWTPFTFLLFLWRPPHQAAALSYLLGLLYLPSAQTLVFPMVPDLNRGVAPAFSVLLANAVLGKGLLRHAKLDGMCKLFVAIVLFWALPRALANGDALHYGPTVVPGIAPRTAITFFLEDGTTLIGTFMVGAAIGSKPEWTRDLLRLWLATTLPYCIFFVLELWLSPKFHTWVYGYFQHMWIQMFRDGGYRPIVFTQHALELAQFMCGAAIAAATLSRWKVRVYRLSSRTAAIGLQVLLVLGKSLASTAYSFCALVLILFDFKRLRAFVAMSIAVLSMLYPLARAYEWVPTDQIIEKLVKDDTPRGHSLAFRLMNEEMMLDKVRERPFTGWGGFGRFRIYDPVTGGDLTVVDGAWMILLASGGFPYFWGVFGLLTWPVLKAYRLVRRRIDPEAAFLTSSLALAAAIFALDLLPNGLGNYLPLLLSGAVLGTVQHYQSQPRGRVSVSPV